MGGARIFDVKGCSVGTTPRAGGQTKMYVYERSKRGN